MLKLPVYNRQPLPELQHAHLQLPRFAITNRKQQRNALRRTSQINSLRQHRHRTRAETHRLRRLMLPLSITLLAGKQKTHINQSRARHRALKMTGKRRNQPAAKPIRQPEQHRIPLLDQGRHTNPVLNLTIGNRNLTKLRQNSHIKLFPKTLT